MMDVRNVVRSGMCTLLCMLFTFRLSAQHESDTIVGAIGEVTVQARHIPAEISSSQPLQTLTRSEMEALGLREMAEAVKRFSGVSVRDYGGIGGLKTVSVRSLGAAHTAVSYDGVTVSNSQAGQIDIGRFSLDNVETLSLSVGHGNDLLQSARAYASAGVLSIQTERPLFGKTSEKWRVGLRGGAFGYITPSLRYARKLTQQTSFMVEGDYMRADGIYPFELKNGKYLTTERRRNSDIYSWHAEGNLFHTFADSSRLRMKSYFYKSERGLPGVVILYNSTARERLWDENFFAQFVYDRRISNRWQLRALAKYNHAWNKYEDVNVKYAGGKQTDVHRQDEYYLSAALRWDVASGWAMSLAQDAFVNTLRNNIDDSPNPIRFTSLTAWSLNFRRGGWSAGANLNATFTTDDVESGVKPADRKHLSPSLTFSYRPWSSQLFYLRAMYKSTFRVPTFNDLYYRRSGNTNLKPEDATEFDLGITWSAQPAAILDHFSLKLDAYYNKVSDKIVAFPSVYVWRMANYGKVEIQGVDAALSLSSVPFDWLKARFNASYTYQKALDLTNPKAKNYKQQLPYTPRHSGNASLALETPWGTLGYSLMMVGKRYFMDQNIPENEVESYCEHTLALSKELKLSARTNLRLQLEVTNLTDRQYEVVKYYPMPGRAWRIGAVMEF